MKRIVKKNKSKIGIWTKIKNILNNSPWHSAFTYPIAYMVVTLLICAGFFSIELENLGFFFVLLFYLTPLWVLLGLIISKRRLPYLLSLIIGLVIPITIAMVAYNGYTNAAKRNAIKTIHAQLMKYISSEIQKCKIGESKFMSNSQDCPATAAKAPNVRWPRFWCPRELGKMPVVPADLKGGCENTRDTHDCPSRSEGGVVKPSGTKKGNHLGHP